MGDRCRFRHWLFAAVLLALLGLLAWTPAGNAGSDKGKDCVSCHKHKRGGTGPVRTESLRAGAGVESPHRKPPKADRAKGGKGTDNVMPSSPGERTAPRGNPSNKPGDPARGTTIKR